jgi:hypothetical protein
MTHWKIITATVARNGNPWYPSHVRNSAAYKMLLNAAYHLGRDTEAGYALIALARTMAI